MFHLKQKADSPSRCSNGTVQLRGRRPLLAIASSEHAAGPHNVQKGNTRESSRTRTVERERTRKEKNARLAQTHSLTSSLAQQLILLPRAPLCSTCPSRTAASYYFCALSKYGLFTSGVLQGASLAAGPDGQAERDLVHEVRKVVQQVQSGRGDTAQQVPEEVPERVD